MRSVLLPDKFQAALSSLPEYRTGVHKVKVVLKDGRVFPDVTVAWESEIILVKGREKIPFAADDIEAISAVQPAQPVGKRPLEAGMEHEDSLRPRKIKQVRRRAPETKA
jgi:hypothetical protein